MSQAYTSTFPGKWVPNANIKRREKGRGEWGGWEGGRGYQPSKEGNFIVFLGHQFQDPTTTNQEVISNV